MTISERLSLIGLATLSVAIAWVHSRASADPLAINPRAPIEVRVKNQPASRACLGFDRQELHVVEKPCSPPKPAEKFL